MTYYEIGGTNFYLSEDKTTIYLLVPYTGDGDDFDIELYEDERSGSMFTIADEMLVSDFLEIAEFLENSLLTKGEKR